MVRSSTRQRDPPWRLPLWLGLSLVVCFMANLATVNGGSSPASATPPTTTTTTNNNNNNTTTMIHDGNFKKLLRQCLNALPDDPTACNAMQDWDVSRVTDCSVLFWEPTGDGRNDWRLLPGAAVFNVNLSGWQTSSCTTMRSMFNGATVFHQPIGPWDVSRVTDMSHMFQAAKSFDQDLSAWDTRQAMDMSHMFRYAARFNNGAAATSTSKTLPWNVGQVRHFQFMLHDAKAFQGRIGAWDVSGACDDGDDGSEEELAFVSMFQGATLFQDDISHWNIPKGVRSLRTMFQHAHSFNHDLSRWNVQRVTDFTGMFQNALSYNQTLCWNLTTPIATTPTIFSHNNKLTTNMLEGTNHSRLDPDVKACRNHKLKLQKQAQSSLSSLRIALMTMFCLVGVALTLYRVVRRRRRRRRVVFRSNKVEEEQILFENDGNDTAGRDVFADANGAGEDYFEDEEEGEISFVEEDYIPSKPPTSPHQHQHQQLQGMFGVYGFETPSTT